jgi:CRISPR-associated endoribonuclease Cas6
MRFKISFVREQASSNSIPLHHQKLVTDALGRLIEPITSDRSQFSFSSLKGTSKIQNGFMRFLSSKITLVVSGRNREQVEQLVEALFAHKPFSVGKMNLIPRHKEVIPDPDFQTKMRYLCISPLILVDPNKDAEKALEQVDPTSHQFSDLLYNVVLDRMEKSGFTDDQLNEFAEFEFTPDMQYVTKIQESGKKFARQYKCVSGLPMVGYLLPFTLHAHPDVHKFILETGLGVLTEEGYWMVDTVKR